MTAPADLNPGDLIEAGRFGPLTVLKPPFVDFGEETAKQFQVEYIPDEDRVTVDVQMPPVNGDANDLREATGARDVQFLSLRPLTFRLWYHPSADVTLAVKEETP